MGNETRLARRLRSTSAEATAALGEGLGKRAERGLVVRLEGDLGAGKTCWVRGFARGLEVEDEVTSPTFALRHDYRGRLPLLHFDAWMESRERALLADGGAEALGGEAVAVIEWGERVEEWLPRPHLVLRLWHEDPETRRIELEVVGEDPAGALSALVAELELPVGVVEVI